MPQPPRPSRRIAGRPRRWTGAEDDIERERIRAAKFFRAITIGAVALVLVGGLALWEVWPKSAPMARLQPTEAVPAALPEVATPALAVVTPEVHTPIFVRGINLGGDQVTIDGQRWLSHGLALANGLTLGAETTIAPPEPIAATRLDFDTKSMLDGGLVASGQVKLSQRLPNGDYEVTLWMAGPQGVDPALLVLRLCDSDVTIGTTTGAATWARLGPYRTSVRKHQLDMVIAGLGGAHLAGLAIAVLGHGEANVPPVVSLSNLDDNAQLPRGDIPLVAQVVPGNGRVVAVRFFDGTTRLGEATAPPYTLLWHRPAVGRHELSAVATDSGAVCAGTGPVAVNVMDDDVSSEMRIKCAKDAMRNLGLESSLLSRDTDGWRLSLANNQAISDVSWLEGVPLTSLDLRGTKVTDFNVLVGMPLRALSIHGTKPHDLTFLKGLPLVELRMMDCDVTDLTPLAGLKLALLEAGNNPVATLAPLAGMKLKSLNLIHLKIDIAPLKGMPLEYLCLDDTQVSDLTPLAGMPLQRLDLWGCPVTSLAPLAGMPLKALLMSRSQVTDLTPIAGMPLIDLDLRGCEQLVSLAPVATLNRLRHLYLPTALPDLGALDALVNVQVREDGNEQARAIGDFIKDWKATRGKK